MATTTKSETPKVRTVSSPGLVHFGLTDYEWCDVKDIPLVSTATPSRARAIARALMAAADDSERIADAFPQLAPADPATAIPTTAGAPGNESVRGDELHDEPYDPERETDRERI